MSSKPLSAWALLFETEKVNTFFQRVNNIGTVIIHKKWATSIASDNGKIIFEVKETYLASQINEFLTRCYKNNTAMRTWCHPPSLSSAEKVSIQLINPSHFISNEQILDTISFLVYLVKYNLKANYSSFLQQLTYTCSNTSSLGALISFDDLCAKFTTEYQHIPLNSMKSFLADFCIGLVNKQFEELNKEAEEKYDSFVLSKLDGRVYIDNYGPFNDFYAEVMLPSWIMMHFLQQHCLLPLCRYLLLQKSLLVIQCHQPLRQPPVLLSPQSRGLYQQMLISKKI